MTVSVSRIGRLFGDRVLLRRLDKPDKVRGLFVPAQYAKDQPKEQELWFGVIEKFGLDARYPEAYGLKEGDLVGVDGLGLSNAAFLGDDGHEHVWVMEEFLAVKDLGRVKDFRDGKKSGKLTGVRMEPLGAYSVVRPHPEESRKSGVIVPDSAKEVSKTGTVLAVSAGQVKGGELVPLNVHADTDVLYGKYSGNWAKFGDEHFLLVKEEDLIAEFMPEKELAHAS